MAVPMDDDGVPTQPVDPEVIRSALQSDSDIVRSQGATVAAGVSSEDPEALEPVVPTLVDVLDDDMRTVDFQTSIALSNVGETQPELIADAVPDLVALLDHELPVVTSMASRALGYIGIESPERIADHVDAIVEVVAEDPAPAVERDTIESLEIDDDQAQSYHKMNRESIKRQQLTRNVAANLLVEVAEYDPSLLAGHEDVLNDLLSSQDANVLAPAADVVGTMARADAGTFGDATRDALVAVLDHPDDSVAATAVRALGFLEDESAVEDLQRVADDDERDDDLRDLAADTAAYLGGRED